jgi:hypothetical protein
MDDPLNHFVPVKGQLFRTHAEWVNTASRRLTCHPEYKNTEHGKAKGYRGQHFTAMCFDQKGRRCWRGSDFALAEEESAFPIWWIWPDQIVGLINPVNPTEGE